MNRKNYLVCVIVATVLLGTLYPLFLDALGGGKISVGPPYFDTVFVPLMVPVLLLIERANGEERKELEDLVQDWQTGSINALNGLLSKYDTLSASLEILHEYLDKARHALRPLSGSAGRNGLLGLTDYLARQSGALGGRG